MFCALTIAFIFGFADMVPPIWPYRIDAIPLITFVVEITIGTWLLFHLVLIDDTSFVRIG